jgi:DNA-binding XRE family transcriptional regulator
MPQKIGPGANDLAYTLKELREYAKLSQKELANKLEIKPPTYHQWESGRRTLSLPTIQKICRIFECAAYVKEDGIWFVDIYQHPNQE